MRLEGRHVLLDLYQAAAHHEVILFNDGTISADLSTDLYTVRDPIKVAFAWQAMHKAHLQSGENEA